MRAVRAVAIGIVSVFAVVCMTGATAVAMPVEEQHRCSLQDGQRVCQAITPAAPLLAAVTSTPRALVLPGLVVLVLVPPSADLVSDKSVRPLCSRSPPAA